MDITIKAKSSISNLLNELSIDPKYINFFNDIKINQFFSDEIIVGYKYPFYYLAFKFVDNRCQDSLDGIVLDIEDNINQLSHSFKMNYYNHEIISDILLFHIKQFLDFLSIKKKSDYEL